MANRIHITTAIFYSNGPPHVGHAYETFAADVFARYYRRKLGKRNVTFVTGTDEHGDKNQARRDAAGLQPKEFADKITEAFREAWAGLNISYDYFVRTTDRASDSSCRRCSRDAIECGDIYFKDYEGLYCVGCERFYTEKELLPGNICPMHNTPVELHQGRQLFPEAREVSRAGSPQYREQSRLHPARALSQRGAQMLAEPLEDLCISRPKARLDWGIELPFDDKYVTYVWYDAFWAYLSELPDTSDAALKEILPVTEHFIGKDILKTHAVYWPAMLMTAACRSIAI